MHRRAVLAALVLAAVSAIPARAQVSPGPLSRAHQQLDGAASCFKCHGAKNDAMNGKCLECHTEIDWLIQQRRGLHGTQDDRNCARCHPDHAGVEFDLIAWEDGDASRFDHARAGWPLEGRHMKLDCAQCHQPKFHRSEAARLGPRRPAGPRWAGLEPGCATCHDDPHRGALGDDCARCHGADAWKPAPGFDHSRTGYPLTGRHARVACAACHESAVLHPSRDEAGHVIPIYKPVPHQECSSCHMDPHKGQLGPSCAQCHSTDDFRQVPHAAFDHDKTRYPLRGAHRALACAACHDEKTAWGKRPQFAACGSCHQDAHAGQATLATKKADCGACHTMEAWLPSSYGVAQHASSAYALEGRHQRVACAACHLHNPARADPARLGSAGVLMRPRHGACMDCHADAHGGQLASRRDKGACAGCHTVAGWIASTFTLERHTPLRLPLEGAHAALACAACHGPRRTGLGPLPDEQRLGTARVCLVMTQVKCDDCHLNPHAGAVATAGARAPAHTCTECHDAVSFHAPRVDAAMHAGFAFKLEGAHLAVPCQACHEELTAAASHSSLRFAASGAQPATAARALTFRSKATHCVDCHTNPHGDQFAKRRGGGDCATCHDSGRFAPASHFDHTRDAAFALDGAHARVPCRSCHMSKLLAGGARQVIYRPLPVRCEDCHAGRPSGPQRSSNAPPRAPAFAGGGTLQ